MWNGDNSKKWIQAKFQKGKRKASVYVTWAISEASLWQGSKTDEWVHSQVCQCMMDGRRRTFILRYDSCQPRSGKHTGSAAVTGWACRGGNSASTAASTLTCFSQRAQTPTKARRLSTASGEPVKPLARDSQDVHHITRPIRDRRMIANCF